MTNAFDFTQPQVAAALISVLGALVSILATIQIARRNVHKDARSRARVEWNTLFRNNLASFITNIDCYQRALEQAAEPLLDNARKTMLLSGYNLLAMLDPSKEQAQFALQVKNCMSNALNKAMSYQPGADLEKLMCDGRKITDQQWRLAMVGI